MEYIIIVEGKDKYCFSEIKEVVEKFLDKDFYSLTEEEKYNKIRRKTMMNAIIRKIGVKDLKKGDLIKDIKEKQYIILNEITFLLSLAKNNDIVIYEKENANKFTKDINKESLERVAKEYIRINDCADELLENILKTLGESHEKRI